MNVDLYLSVYPMTLGADREADKVKRQGLSSHHRSPGQHLWRRREGEQKGSRAWLLNPWLDSARFNMTGRPSPLPHSLGFRGNQPGRRRVNVGVHGLRFLSLLVGVRCAFLFFPVSHFFSLHTLRSLHESMGLHPP